MDSISLAQRVKDLRIRKGYSQEELSAKTGLSLRTVQRIENSENEPRGDSLRRLASALQVTPDDLTDWDMPEDRGYINGMNLSALCFIVFPFFGIVVPLIMWISKRDKLKSVNRTGKIIINFQITWTMLLFLISIILPAIFVDLDAVKGGPMQMAAFSNYMYVFLGFWFFMMIYNVIMILINSYRIHKGKDVVYFPMIHFLRRD